MHMCVCLECALDVYASGLDFFQLRNAASVNWFSFAMGIVPVLKPCFWPILEEREIAKMLVYS